jgi:hypothetical protein
MPEERRQQMYLLRIRLLPTVLALSMWIFSASVSQASIIYYYTDWTADTLSPTTPPAVNGSASGTITTPQGTVNVSYTGEVVNATQINCGSCTNFWNFPEYQPAATGFSAPSNEDIIMLAEYAQYTDTVTFSTPVVNPVFDIATLGSSGAAVSYIFNATPVHLSFGPGVFPQTPNNCTTCFSILGNTLSAMEGNGVIEFLGTFSSISWTTSGGEYYNGFTVGVAASLPEPATWTLLLLAGVFATPFMIRGGTKFHCATASNRDGHA